MCLADGWLQRVDRWLCSWGWGPLTAACWWRSGVWCPGCCCCWAASWRSSSSLPSSTSSSSPRQTCMWCLKLQGNLHWQSFVICGDNLFICNTLRSYSEQTAHNSSHSNFFGSSGVSKPFCEVLRTKNKLLSPGSPSDLISQYALKCQLCSLLKCSEKDSQSVDRNAYYILN